MLKYCSTLQNILNKALVNNSFPKKLKPGDITPIFQKDRPVSIFRSILKKFERLTQNQILSYDLL